MIVRRILAPNPGWLTGPGTNSYVVRSGDTVVVVDPGPDDTAHRDRLVEACAGYHTAAIVVTHSHPDHAPAANPLGDLLHAPVLGPGDGPGFKPDRHLADGDSVRCGAVVMTAIATPGHCAEHVCFHAGNDLFTGDVVLGGSSVVVEDLVAYLGSLRRLLALQAARIWPGHGDAIDDPTAAIEALIRHRLEREEQVLEALGAGAATIGDIVARVYRDVPAVLHPAAAVSVAAHVRKLHDEGRVEFSPGAAESGAPVLRREETAG